jgi:UDP-glucose 4-epimerase
MKQILITGVAGMLGSHLLDALLERGNKVIGIDNLSYGKMENIAHNLENENFSFYRVDVRDIDTLKILSKDVDWIVHLAAVKKINESQSAIDTLTVNVEGTKNVLEVAKMWGCKVIFASTSDVYGTSPDIPLKEDGDLVIGPSMIKRWSYAVSKLYGEQLCFSYYKDYGVPIVILRYFGAFSHRSSFLWSGGHIPIFIHAILNDEEVIIHGDGKQTRSMAYVSDLVDGTILAMECEDAIGQIINIGNDEELSVLDTAYLIHRIANTGRELRLRFVPFEEVFGQGYKDIMRRVPDLTKAKKILGYSPKVKLEEAIKFTIEEIKKNKIKRDKDECED